MVATQHLARVRATRGHHDRFLHRVVTGDEKWCLYVNMKERADWVPPGGAAKPRVKQDLHPKKVMLCVWWDWKGPIHWELLGKNQRVTSDLYVAQLHRVKQALEENRPDWQGDVILLHDNARPHTAKNTKAALKEFGWEVLSHPPYSPDLAPTDYHLFRSLASYLSRREFDDEQDLKLGLAEYFRSKDGHFWKRGIYNLVNRWEEVVNNDGNYIINM